MLREESDDRLISRISSLIKATASLEKEWSRHTSDGSHAEEETRDFTPPSLESALRKLGAGEARVRGRLLRVDCDQQGIGFPVMVGQSTVNLRADALDQVRFITFTSDVRGEVTCGSRTPADDVVVTYLSPKGGRSRRDGTVVSVEFVPRDFELKQEH
jgi:hypothetical protein